MESKKFNGGGIFAGLLGVVFIGAALSGVMFNDYWLDEAEECKNAQAINDKDCIDYPYQDGNGNSPTPLNERWTNDETDYKKPYDVFADAVRDQCELINECEPTSPNFKSEVDLFCTIESFSLNGWLNFPGNIAQDVIRYESESGFDMSDSIIMIQDICYPGGTGGTFVSGDLPTLQVPE